MHANDIAEIFDGQTEAELRSALDSYQEWYWESSGDAGAMPKDAVLQCLAELGYGDCYDHEGSILFFGEGGRESWWTGSTENGARILGGFIFRSPGGELYELACASTSPGNPLLEHLGDEFAHNSIAESAGESVGRGFRSLWSRFRARGRSSSASESRAAARWYMARAQTYAVEPRFYEELHPLDFMEDEPGSLVDLYPPDVSAGSIDANTGMVTVETAEDATTTCEGLRASMAAHGVLCDPRVLLMSRFGRTPLLPESARAERLRSVEMRRTGPSSRDEHEHALLDIGTGHRNQDQRIHQGRRPLVPDQEAAAEITRCLEYLRAYANRRAIADAKLPDPYLSEYRKQAIRAQRDSAASFELDALQKLETVDDLMPKIAELLRENINEQ